MIKHKSITVHQSDSSQSDKNQYILIFLCQFRKLRWQENVNVFDSRENCFKAESFRKQLGLRIVIMTENYSIPLFLSVYYLDMQMSIFQKFQGLFVFCFLFNISAENVRLKVYNINKMDARAEQVEICKQGQPKSIYHAPNSIFSIGCTDTLRIKTITI